MKKVTYSHAMQLAKLKKGHVSIPYYLTPNFFAYYETVKIIILTPQRYMFGP